MKSKKELLEERISLARLRIIILFISFIGGALVLSFVFLSTPETIGPIGIMFWFGLLAIAMTGIQLMIRLRPIYRNQTRTKLQTRPDWSIIRTQLIRSLVVSIIIVVILAVRSLRIIDYRDGVLLILTIIVVELVRNLRPGARNIKKID
ncbi:hypothetical protein KA531_02750 [Candidatus Saccharibacteria bacterium]|nr:hypothetical protein [Candidatus Saccharibacteria bacterium]